jgi:glycerol-3-phosphate dehydrogenase (NAD(P)+)
MIASDRENRIYLPGAIFPESLVVSSSLRESLEAANFIVLAIPCQGVRATMESLSALGESRLPIVSGTKGIEQGSLRMVSEIVSECYSSNPDHYAVLSGPSFAREVVRSSPTAVVVASHSQTMAKEIQLLFNTNCFKVYTRTDVKGLEICGALKNVIALAAGISDGMGLGANSRAALLTRGLAEMTRLGVALGAKATTFSGLGGVGDLYLTATGEQSRNRTVGVRLGRGEKLPDILRDLGQVAEGVTTAQSAHMLAMRHGVDLPVTRAVYRLLYEGATLVDVLRDIMDRPMKDEEEF